jgi:GNAT superfamily N-acetyltransferase
MEIRTARYADIPAIVSLLKESLGESLMPKSEAYWSWKHLHNPFGESPVLLAFENDTLIGVRAFMPWRWKNNDRIFKTVRAVDTATHPLHQGKGVFKKLTLGLVDQCKSEGVDFVFNTPNSQSKPGYLKMGWKEAGKLPIRFYWQRPIGSVIAFAQRRQFGLPPVDNTVFEILRHPAMNDLVKATTSFNHRNLVTDHSIESLRWRYQQVPVVNYHACAITTGNDLQAVAFYRFKASRIGLELRVADQFSSHAKHSRLLAQVLISKAEEAQAHYLTSSGCDYNFKFSGLLATAQIKAGPCVTVRALNGNPSDKLLRFSAWSPSIGDLELF